MHCKANFFLFWDIFVSETNTMFLMQNVAKQCSNLPIPFSFTCFWDIFVSETNTMFLMQNVAKQCSKLPRLRCIYVLC